MMTARVVRTVSSRTHDEGLGLAEVLISILLFGIIAVAAVPAIIVAVQVSGKTTTVASAAGVANERIEIARSQTASCAEFVAFLQASPGTYTDARGVGFTVSQTPSAGTAAASVVVPHSAGDADGDGVLDAFCDNTTRNAVNFVVDVTAVEIGSSDVANVATIIAVPGY